MSDIYKGDVVAVQDVASQSSGSSCGLEIPRRGEFLVFATREGFDLELARGQYYAGLCGGTRSTKEGPIAVAPVPTHPVTVSD